MLQGQSDDTGIPSEKNVRLDCCGSVSEIQVKKLEQSPSVGTYFVDLLILIFSDVYFYGSTSTADINYSEVHQCTSHSLNRIFDIFSWLQWNFISYHFFSIFFSFFFFFSISNELVRLSWYQVISVLFTSKCYLSHCSTIFIKNLKKKSFSMHGFIIKLHEIIRKHAVKVKPQLKRVKIAGEIRKIAIARLNELKMVEETLTSL